MFCDSVTLTSECAETLIKIYTYYRRGNCLVLKAQRPSFGI